MAAMRQDQPLVAAPTRAARSTDADGTRPAKMRRIRLACRRCQQRKIKCDEALPKCSACQRAHTKCEDGQRSRPEEGIARSQAQYIQRLESALRDRVPELPLESLQSEGAARSEARIETTIPSEGQPPFDTPEAQEADSTHMQNTNNIAEGQYHITDDGQTTEDLSQNVVEEDEENEDNDTVAHDIGLVPLSSGVSRYVGPSSGFIFAKTIFNRVGLDNRDVASQNAASLVTVESPSTTTSRSLLPIRPEALPLSLDHATQLSRIYFEHVHTQHPFLHKPTFFRLLMRVYDTGAQIPKWLFFQVKMVLAISATILARRLPLPYSGEGLYASAMQDKDEIDFHSSLDGVQCLLLVYMYNLHSPFGNISSWHLNYQFLAVVLDLGLQRDVPTSARISPLEKEMRTRIFWVIYSIDRKLATILGRPIGLRDEACDLRLPSDVDDTQLQSLNGQSSDLIGPDITVLRGSMACALTLFKLARLNSELKYILHSISHVVPNYTYPQITDISAWQGDMWQRLQECLESAPKFTDDRRYLSTLCEIRFHEVTMHLFRPTPRIRSPSTSSLSKCHDSAIKTISLWTELYKLDRLSYSWTMIHSICLSALTILYCIWTSTPTARSTKIDVFMATMREASVLLGITGEYWTEARRSRGRLDGLVNATVRWLVDKLVSNSEIHRSVRHGSSQSRPRASQSGVTANYTTDNSREQPQAAYHSVEESDFNSLFGNYVNNDDLVTFLGASTWDGDNETLMDSLFVDYQPLFDLNSGDMNFDTFG